jgi:serine/threonine-protein kinase
LIEGGDQAVYANGNRLLFRQRDALFTVGFDAAHTTVDGPRTRLGESFGVNLTTGASLSVARDGTFLSAPPSIQNGHLMWVSMAGVERVVPGATRAFTNPRVSLRGRSIAFSDFGGIWTLDPDRGTATRVSKGNDPLIGYPAWSPDGTRIYYRSADGVKVARADGEGAPTLLPGTSVNDYPSSLTPDGRKLVMLRLTTETSGDVVSMPVEGGGVTPLVSTPAYESGPQVSPDGQWLLYVSDETGRMEVYLRPMSGPDRKWPVSTDGGLHPLWSRDGRQVFYRSGQRMLAVDVTTTPDVRLGAPRVLFERRYAFGPNVTFPNFSLSADGRDFLMVQEEPGGRHFDLVLNWMQNLAK